MKRSGIFILVICLTAFATAVGAETAKQREQRESFQRYLETRYNEVNQKLRGVSGKASKVGEDSRNEFKRLTEELNKKHAMAARKMAELKSATAENWDRLKVETISAIDDVNNTYERVMSLVTK